MKKDIQTIIKEFSGKLPKFSDGRIDYSTSDSAPVVTVFVKVGDEFLLLKRSDKVRAYQGKWNSIAGYLDEVRPVGEKVLEELREELGVLPELVLQTRIADYYEIYDKEIDKTWITTPVLVELKEKPEIKLDWEHTDYKWIKKGDLAKFDIVTDLDKTFEKVL